MLTLLLVVLAAGALVPGTTLRLGMPIAVLEGSGEFGPGPAPGDTTVVTRRGTVRFFGQDAGATLTFRDGRLSQAELAADSLSPAVRDYIEDELTRAGYRRRCARWEPAAHVCDWSGRTDVHLEVTVAGVKARVQESGVTPAPPPGHHEAPADTGSMEPERGPPREEPTLKIPLTGAPRLDSAPVLDSCEAVRPEAARRAGIFGRVTVRATVDTAGVVTDAVIERGVPELHAAALACAREYRFRPYVLDARPVPFVTQVTIRFVR